MSRTHGSGIDGSLVKGVLHDPIDREMVRSIKEIIEALRRLGVDYAQGHGVSQQQRVQRPIFRIDRIVSCAPNEEKSNG